MTDKMQNLKGFRDFLPREMKVRQRVLSTIKQVFESFGFEPLETPALEYAKTLLGKYGKETDKLVYTFKDKGSREVGLRYDLTVPVSRVLAQYQDKICLPFKRYQIQRVWRADKPQKGRYREFTMCDIDTFGVNSPMADAEIIAIIYYVLKKLNFEKFTIRINSREILFEIFKKAGIIDIDQQLLAIQSIDKLDKKSKQEVMGELREKGFSMEVIKNIFTNVRLAKPNDYLKEMFEIIELLGVDRAFYDFDPVLARGLDYYTGPIFETIVEKPKIGSITGGGRYDKLISQLGGPDIPATGTTIGLDRVCDVIAELGLLGEGYASEKKILITIFNKSLKVKSLQIFSFLRRKGIKVEIYLDLNASLEKQLKYADRRKIPFVLIIGPNEVKEMVIIIKDMKNRTQKRIKEKDLISEMQQRGFVTKEGMARKL